MPRLMVNNYMPLKFSIIPDEITIILTTIHLWPDNSKSHSFKSRDYLRYSHQMISPLHWSFRYHVLY